MNDSPRILTLIMLTVGFLSYAGGAHARPKKAGLDFSKVSYDCGTTSGVDLEKIQRFTEETLTEGLNKIKEINETLYDQAVQILNSEPVVVSCEKGNVGVASYVGKYGFHAAKIYMGDSQPYLDRALSPRDDEDEHEKAIRLAVRHNLFHEFLHHFRFDNQDKDAHEAELLMQRDLVHACAYYAFTHYLAFSLTEDASRDVCSQAGSAAKTSH